MKKGLMFIASALFILVLVSCIEVEVKDVTSIELSWQPEEAYILDEDNFNLSNKSVVVNFEDGTDQTLSFGDANLTIRGDIVGGTHLDTSTVGEKNVKVSYGGVTVDIYYFVADVIVDPLDDIKSLIEGSVAGSTIYISTGDYYINANIELSLDNVSIVGPRYGTAKITSNALRIFLVTGTNISISNLTLTSGTHEGVTGFPGIIEIRTGADNINIDNNVIFASYARFTNYKSMNLIGINVKKADGSNYGDVDHLTITNNTIYNVRQGIQLGYSGRSVGASIVVNDNNIFHTKGGILLWLQNSAQLANIERLRNSWESTVEGYRSHNEADMNYHTLQWTDESIDYSANLVLSSQNNGAHFQDRRWCLFDGVNEHCTLGNGGGVPTNDGVTPVIIEGVSWYVFDIDGDPLDSLDHPDAVYIYSGNSWQNGTRFNRTHMTIREYEENTFYDVSIDVLNAENGNVREAIWVEIDGGTTSDERSASIDLAVTGLIPGGTIVEWINEQWVTVDPAEYND